eukprot:TCALIF_10355-PA protein Name:"Similar to Chst1 Carbohydrate sulfotransferase 1 (Mus musculus)" AED:0.10 eAED:0.11 QI:0/0/0/0.5/0/0.5/4/0/399
MSSRKYFDRETSTHLSDITNNHNHVKNQTLNQMEKDFVHTFWSLLNKELAEPEKHWVQKLIPKPRKVLIISSVRSGSSFFGQLLNQFPGTYYFFEPIKTRRVVDANLVEFLKDVLSCNCKNIAFSNSNHHVLRHNIRLMPLCNESAPLEVKRMCFNSDLLSEVCSLFPIRLIKTVRFEARMVERLMEMVPDLTVISLIRDVRGGIVSRQKVPWCDPSNCADVKSVCKRYNQDVESSIDLTSRYPERFKIVRYEDLSLNLNQTVQSVADFLGFPLDQQARIIMTFLADHTQSDEVERRNVSLNPHSIVRQTSLHTFQWRYSIQPKQLNQTQHLCAKGLSLMGFRLMPTIEDLLNPQAIIEEKTEDEDDFVLGLKILAGCTLLMPPIIELSIPNEQEFVNY